MFVVVQTRREVYEITSCQNKLLLILLQIVFLPSLPFHQYLLQAHRGWLILTLSQVVPCCSPSPLPLEMC